MTIQNCPKCGSYNISYATSGIYCNDCGYPNGSTIYTSSTTTTSIPKYKDWEINEIIRYVRDAKTEEDAVHNIKIILKEYKKMIGVLELIKLLLKK